MEAIEEKKLAIFEEAVSLLEQRGYEASVHSDYSGRYMCGETVPGISTDASGVVVGWAVACAIANSAASGEVDVEDLSFQFFPTREDSLGRGRIYY